MTSTADWLTGEEWADVALVLWIDGLNLGFTEHPDAAQIATEWNAATAGNFWNIRGGLEVSGSVARTIEIFAATIKPSSLSFSVLDFDAVLTPLLFGQGRTDIRKTYLAQSIDCEETTLYVDDVGQITGLDTLYCGLETMVPTAEDDGLNTWTVIRGVSSIFPRALLDVRGQSHDVPPTGGERPMITDIPTKWVNRQVGLYVCHRVDGVWSAGFPGTTDNDAELLWAGRLKTWSRGGEGWLDLDCVEITEMLKTTIGARMYTGALAEGMHLSAGNAEMQVDVVQYTRNNVTHVLTETPFDTYIVTLSLSGSRVSHQELAENINSELSICFAGASETYGPEDMTAQIFQDANDGHYRIQVVYLPATPEDTFIIHISLAPLVWQMLGYQSDHAGEGAYPNSTGTGDIADILIPRAGQLWERRASDLPKKFGLAFDPRIPGVDKPIDVTPSTSDEFVAQAYLPDGFETAQGFLLLAGKRIAGVRRVGDNSFEIVGELLGMTQQSDEDNVGADFEEFFTAADTGDGPVEVRQVWIEPSGPGGVGRVMLRLLSSTGTLNYNYPFYDTLPATLGARFPGSLIDAAAWLAFTMSYTLVVLKPTPLVTYIESFLRLVGAQAAWKDSLLSVVRPTEGADADELVQLDETNKAQKVEPGGNLAAVTLRTVVEYNPERIINRLTLNFQQQLDGKFNRTITVNDEASQSDNDGQVGAKVIDALGMYGKINALPPGVVEWSTSVAGAALAYFSRPVALAHTTYGFNLVTRLFPGAKVIVDDDGMINPATGKPGVVGLLGWVVATDFDWGTGVGKCSYAFQPDAATTSTAPRITPFAPSARVDETYDATSGDDVPPAGATDFTFTFAGVLTSGSAAASTAPSSASITLPENTLVILDVENYHSTSASLAAAPSVAGTGGETWVPLDDRTTGGAAPNRRISRFATMVAADTVTAVTMTFGGAQTNVGWTISWVGGTDTTGADGAGALGVTDGADSTGVAQSSLDIPLTSDDFRNGLVATFVSGFNAGLTPRSGWTEEADFTVSTTSANRIQVQFRATSDTDAAASGNISVWAGLATEVVSNNIGFRTVDTYYPGAVNVGTWPRTRSIAVTAGRQYLFQCESNTTAVIVITVVRADGTPVVPTPTFTSDYAFTTTTGARFQFFRMSVPTVTETLKFSYSSSGGAYFAAAIHEVWNFNPAVGSGSGIVQKLGANVTGTPIHTFGIAPPGDRNNGMLMLYSYGSGLLTVPPGWRRIYGLSGDGSIVQQLAMARGNADSAPSIATFNHATVASGGIVYEIEPAPRVYVATASAGYDSATKTLRFRPHEYTLETQGVDVSFFQDGDPVHIVDLSPTDPDAPIEWFTGLDGAPDTVANEVVLADDLAGWPDRGHFVMEWGDISAAVANKPDQLTRGSFLADAVLRSTGNANNDAYLWGGDPNGGPADVPLEQDQPYRRLNNAADDLGTAFSTHKLHEMRDWLNTALAWTTRPTFLNEVFPTPATAIPSGWVRAMLMPPVWIPLYAGSSRSIEVSALLAMETAVDGGVLVRLTTVEAPPPDDGEFLDPDYGDAQFFADIDVPQTTTYAWYTVVLDTPAVRSGPVRGCYVTFDVLLYAPADTGQVNLRGLRVAEAAP